MERKSRLGEQVMNEVIKKRSDGTTLVIKEISYEVAKQMMIKNHYSHKWNTSFGKYNFGIFKDNRLLGGAVYGNLMNPKSAFKIIDSGKVIELNRLWIDDELGHNTETMFLSATFQLLRGNTDIDVIQSFADGRLGVGTIYKAASFGYYGYDETLFFENTKTFETQHKVPVENTKRPRLFLKSNIEIARGEMRPFKVRTYRYLFPLRKKLKINMERLPYPQYHKGEIHIENFIQSIGTLARVFLMLESLNMKESDEIKCYALKHYQGSLFETEIEKQKENKSYNWFIHEYKDKSGLVDFIRGTSEIELANEQISLF